MRNNIFILFDCPDDRNDKKWLYEGLLKMQNNVYSVSVKHKLSDLTLKGGLIKKIHAHLIMLLQCFRCLLKSNNNDVVICWLSTTGMYFNLLSRLFGNTRNIILLNILTPLGRSKLRAFGLSNPKCCFCVNSEDTPDQFRYLYSDIKAHFHFIPDVYDDNIAFQTREFDTIDKYCFTGGFNNRDWTFVNTLARLMPHVKFICVGDEQVFNNMVEQKEDNVITYFSIDANKYYDLMKKSHLVFLPLIDDRVAGLINIIRAAQYGVLCAISDTKSTNQYLGNQDKDMLIHGDLQETKLMIDRIFSLSQDEYQSKLSRFQKHIQDVFSPQSATDKVYKVVTDFNN